jgi:hypothetical protein
MGAFCIFIKIIEKSNDLVGNARANARANFLKKWK